MRININITDAQNEALESISSLKGITKNGIICDAIHQYLMREAPYSERYLRVLSSDLRTSRS